MDPKENGNHGFTVKELGSPTVIDTAGEEGCHLLIFTLHLSFPLEPRSVPELTQSG